MNKMLARSCIAAVLGAGAVTMAHAGSTTLQGDLLPFYTTYGDANVYSLPTLQYIYCRSQGGAPNKLGCGGGNPYAVDSSVGQIKDLTVLGTGASGKPVNQNFALMNDAYPTPSGVSGSPYFSTGSVADPGSSFGAPANDLSTTWDASLASLQTFLTGAGGGELLFFFNNNQNGTISVNLAAWGRVWITDNNNVQVGDQYYLTNQKKAYGQGGVDLGDPTAFTGANNASPFVGADNSSTDYVLSGSGFCVDSNTFLPVACGSPGASPSIEHNLGADEAAYAVHLPELNAQLGTLFGSGANLTNYTLHVEVRLGCQAANGTDAEASAANGGTTHCLDQGLNRSLNNGYEQIFIGTGNLSQLVPEPGTISLLGIAFAALWLGMGRRRKVGALW